MSRKYHEYGEYGENDSVDLYSMSGARKHKRKKKHNKVRILINTVASLVLAFSILMVSATVVLGMHPITDENGGVETAEGLEDLVTSSHSGVSYVLVIGLDKSEALTDIILVACIDHEKGTMSLLQIPRDTFVGTDIPTCKVNAVYNNPRSGELKINALRRRLSSAFGIPIDHYVIFTLEGFRNVIDAIGGVDINITQENGIRIENHVDGTDMVIGPGEVHLDGIMAEGFMRKRYGVRIGTATSGEEGYGLGDISRVQQQRVFYAAVAKKLKAMSLASMIKIATTCYDQVSTSMSVSEMLAYAKEVQSIDMESMVIKTVPGQFVNYNAGKINGNVALSYYSVIKSEYVAMYNEYFNPYGTQLTESDINVPELHKLLGITETGSVVTDGGTLGDIQSTTDVLEDADD